MVVKFGTKKIASRERPCERTTPNRGNKVESCLGGRLGEPLFDAGFTVDDVERAKMPSLSFWGTGEGSLELPDPDLENGAEFVNAVKHKTFLIIKLVWGRGMAAPSEVLQSVTFFYNIFLLLF